MDAGRALRDLADDFEGQRGESGLFASSTQVAFAAVAAARFYLGFAALADLSATSLSEVTDDTRVSASEWALIAPLFALYVDREVARIVEGARGAGLDGGGRSTSEVEADIQRLEAELPLLAFVMPFASVGLDVVPPPG